MTAHAVTESERIESIDVLRGFALLGILVMNIQSFGLIGAAYTYPPAYGDLTGWNYAAWLLSHLFADLKFLSIFSMLFGAGIVLMTGRAEESAGRAAAIHYRRMAVLLLFGLVHAYCFWFGDILFSYAVCGMLLYPFRRCQPRTLIALGVAVFAINTALVLGLHATVPHWPEEAIREMVKGIRPPDEDVRKELEAFRGGWLTQMPFRARGALMMQAFVFPLIFLWRAGGLILVGMGLFKLGVFSARLPRGRYQAMLVAGLAIGLPLTAAGHHQVLTSAWDPIFTMFAGAQWNYWGSFFVALAYVGGVMLACQSSWIKPWLGPLAAVGRTALSCYLLQTLICTTIFYGHGLGYFGTLDRAALLGVVAGVWLVELILAPLWLRYFLYGPAEWLWRTLTYGQAPTMRRSRVTPGQSAAGE